MTAFPVTAAIALDSLSSPDIRQLQEWLLRAKFSPGPIDGLLGPLTVEAWASFKESVNLHSIDEIRLIGPSSYASLMKVVNSNNGVIHNFSTRQGTIDAIRWECNSHGLIHRNQQAYVLATTQHETAGTFKPLEEYGKGRKHSYGRIDPSTGKAYYGRGFVQLTWKSNYQKYATILGIDLVRRPELATDPNVALFILVHGMRTGAFTGRKLSDYVNGGKTDFLNARRVVNGMDRASQIAAIARNYL
jgi:predicted chitinase